MCTNGVFHKPCTLHAPFQQEWPSVRHISSLHRHWTLEPLTACPPEAQQGRVKRQLLNVCIRFLLAQLHPGHPYYVHGTIHSSPEQAGFLSNHVVSSPWNRKGDSSSLALMYMPVYRQAPPLLTAHYTWMHFSLFTVCLHTLYRIYRSLTEVQFCTKCHLIEELCLLL